MMTVSPPRYWSRLFGPLGCVVILVFVMLLNGVVVAMPSSEAQSDGPPRAVATTRHAEQCSREGGQQLPDTPRCPHHFQCCALCTDGCLSIARAVFDVVIDACHFYDDGVTLASARSPAPKPRLGLLTTGSPRSPPAAA